MLDKDVESCVSVGKRGMRTGLTWGFVDSIMTVARRPSRNCTKLTALEWPIYALDRHSAPFSDRGDSGSIIFNATGRVGGMLTVVRESRLALR
jgi:hypothetical protein